MRGRRSALARARVRAKRRDRDALEKTALVSSSVKGRMLGKGKEGRESKEGGGSEGSWLRLLGRGGAAFPAGAQTFARVPTPVSPQPARPYPLSPALPPTDRHPQAQPSPCPRTFACHVCQEVALALTSSLDPPAGPDPNEPRPSLRQMISDTTLTALAVRPPCRPVPGLVARKTVPRADPPLFPHPSQNSLGVVAMGLIVGYHVLEVNQEGETED